MGSTCRSRGRDCSLQQVNSTLALQSCLIDEDTGAAKYLTLANAYTTSLTFRKGRSNPFDFWIWAIIDSSQAESQSALIEDPEILRMNESLSLIMDCEVSVFNISYKILNGSLDTASVGIRLARDAPSYVIADPMALDFAQNQLYERLRVSAATETSSFGITEVMSRYLSEMAIAYVAGIFEPWRNEAESTRRQVQVTRLPAAIVWLVIGNGYLLVLLSLIYWVISFFLMKKDLRSVIRRDYLTLDGLVHRANNHASLAQLTHQAQPSSESQ